MFENLASVYIGENGEKPRVVYNGRVYSIDEFSESIAVNIKCHYSFRGPESKVGEFEKIVGNLDKGFCVDGRI